MPGTATRFDSLTHKPHQHGESTTAKYFPFIRLWALIIATEMWYSAVIRSNWRYGDETAGDLSRKVIEWTRFRLWSNYDLLNKRLHVVVLGWPPASREHFQSIFQGETGLQLQRHPMILHAYFARNLLLKTYDFLHDVSGPLYESASTTPLESTVSANHQCGTPGIQSPAVNTSK